MIDFKAFVQILTLGILSDGKMNLPNRIFCAAGEARVKWCVLCLRPCLSAGGLVRDSEELC